MDKTALKIIEERFGRDTLLSVATVKDGVPYVRIVDGYYEDGSFYAVTYALSEKMKHIERNPVVAVCGEWFTAHGRGENLGWVLDPKNAAVMARLRKAFAAWYDNGHTDESDPNTCLLKIRLTDAVLMAEGKKYILDFAE